MPFKLLYQEESIFIWLHYDTVGSGQGFGDSDISFWIRNYGMPVDTTPSFRIQTASTSNNASNTPKIPNTKSLLG